MGRFERGIDFFDSTIDCMLEQSVTELSHFLKEDNELPLLFIASGGSYSAAVLGEILAVNHGRMAHALTPYMYLESGFQKTPAKVLLITASGNNKDAHRVVENARTSGKQILGVLLINSKSSLLPRMEDVGIKHVFIYPIANYKNDGFLATNTLLATYVLLHLVYEGHLENKWRGCVTEKDKYNIDDFVKRLNHIPDDELTNQEAFLHKLEGVDSFFVLYSAHNVAPAIDIESKFSEGGIGNTQLADYRNFVHGRFNWFTQRPAQTALICMQSPGDTELSEAILERLPESVPIVRLKTEKADSTGMIELFIKAQYLCMRLGNRWGLNLGHPFVPEYGKEIHSL